MMNVHVRGVVTTAGGMILFSAIFDFFGHTALTFLGAFIGVLVGLWIWRENVRRGET